MKVHTLDKQYKYPHLMWDSLPKASASQVHPHAQISLNPTRYYGKLIIATRVGLQFSFGMVSFYLRVHCMHKLMIL